MSKAMRKWRGNSDIDSSYLLICYFHMVDIFQNERITSFVQGNSDHIQTQRICYTIVMKHNSIEWIRSHFDHFHWYTFRETRTFLAEQLQPLSDSEQKEWLNNIASHVQNQSLPSSNVEIKHIELAIKVIALKL